MKRLVARLLLAEAAIISPALRGGLIEASNGWRESNPVRHISPALRGGLIEAACCCSCGARPP